MCRARNPADASWFMTADDWHDRDCTDEVFTDRVFESALFSRTIFNGATFRRCRFEHCRFTHADLQESLFEDCQFPAQADGSKGVEIAFSDLRLARLVKCTLPFARFERSDLHAIEMDQCNLLGARFEKATSSRTLGRTNSIIRATFRHCNLELAEMAEINLAGCDLTGSRLRETDLSLADLTDADLRDCDLFQAVLDGAKLGGADLRGAEISGLDVTRLGGYRKLTITQGQQHILLDALGIDVEPD